MSGQHTRPREVWIILAIALGFVIWSALFIYRSSFIASDGHRYFCLFDDAMISMRYAWNLSHGAGLVWNSGEYVEGYTNLLTTLIMTLATFAFEKSTAPLFMQLLGIGFMLGSACLAVQIANHVTQDLNSRHQALIRVLTFLCVLIYYPLVYWSLMGMETGLLTVLVLGSVLFTLKYSETQQFSYLFWMAICLGLAFLTRPDSAIFAVLNFSFVLLKTYKTKPIKTVTQHILLAGGVYSLFIIGQTMFRWLYYGELLPNTYVLKLTGMPIIERLKNGVRFVRPFFLESALLLLVVYVGMVPFKKIRWFLFSFILAAVAYQIWVGGEPWLYWRILAPAMPLVFILFIQTVLLLVVALSKRLAVVSSNSETKNTFYQNAPEIIVVVIVLTVMMITNIRFLSQIFLITEPYEVGSNRRNVNIAIALNQITSDEATIGVTWAGAIPYFTDRTAVDFLGKSDKVIAHLPPDLSGMTGFKGMSSVPGHNKYDLNYSIKLLQPTYVERFDWGTQDVTAWAESRYVAVEYNGLTLLLRKDSDFVHWNRVNIP